MIKAFQFAVVVGIAFTCTLGCSPHRDSYGGHFYAYFPNEHSAKKAVASGSIEFLHDGSELRISPRSPVGASNRTVCYDLSVLRDSSWNVRTAKEFAGLLAANIEPNPIEVYGIAFQGLQHTDEKFNRSSDIANFWQILEEQPHRPYSANEVANLLPLELSGKIRVDHVAPFTVVLDWPHDERSLILDFQEDDNRNQTVLTGRGLGYPDN